MRIMKTFSRAALAALLMSVASAGAAQAAPVDVTVRIEGASGTLFDRVVRTDGHDIQASGDSMPRKCDGTNLGANAEPGPTATAASVDAMSMIGSDFGGSWYDGYDDYFIERWGPEAEDNANGWWWGILVNREFTPVGGCQVRVAEGDEVLWVLEAFNGRPMLSLEGPSTAIAGKPVEVRVTDFSGNAYAGSTVRGLTAAVAPVPAAVTVPGVSDAGGHGRVTFNRPGWKRLKAYDPAEPGDSIADAVPSNAIDICVERTAGSGCSGEAPSQIPAEVGQPPAVETEEPDEPDPPTCRTDESLCPPPPGCANDPALCPPDEPDVGPKLRFDRVDLGSRRIVRGRSAQIGVTIANVGDTTARRPRVCLRRAAGAARARGLEIPRSCRPGGPLKPGEDRAFTFTVRAPRSLTGRRRIPLRLTAGAEKTPKLSRVVRLGLVRALPPRRPGASTG